MPRASCRRCARRRRARRTSRGAPSTSTRMTVPRAASARSSFDRSRRDEPAVGDDRDLLAQALDELQLVAREEHGGALAARSTSTSRERVDRDRVEAREGLVEDQARRARARARPRAARAAGCRARAPPRGRRAARRRPSRSTSGSPRRRPARAAPCSRAEVAELLVHPHARVQAALLGHVAEALAPTWSTASRRSGRCRCRARARPSRCASWSSCPRRSVRRSRAASASSTVKVRSRLRRDRRNAAQGVELQPGRHVGSRRTDAGETTGRSAHGAFTGANLALRIRARAGCAGRAGSLGRERDLEHGRERRARRSARRCWLRRVWGIWSAPRAPKRLQGTR